MPFKLLKNVVLHLRKTCKCQKCKKGFLEDSIIVLATAAIEEGGYSALFFVLCPNCSTHAFIMAEINETINMQTTSAPNNISVNEILDMHNFLKNWNGDVKKLFQI